MALVLLEAGNALTGCKTSMFFFHDHVLLDILYIRVPKEIDKL